MNYLFFILPFILYAGIALQTAGFIICFFLGPIFLIYKKSIIFNTSHFFSISLLLFLLWGIFPLFNLLHFFFKFDSSLNWQKLLSSHMGSSVLISSICLSALALFQNHSKQNNHKNYKIDNIRMLQSLLKGFLIASIIIFVYCLIQHITGFHILSKNFFLAQEHQMNSGTYRVFSFFGHPLTMASVSLAFFVFFTNLYLFLFDHSNNQVSKIIKLCIPIALINFALIIFSGSRFAFLISFVYIFLFSFNLLKLKRKKNILVFLLIFSTLSVLAILKLGITARILPFLYSFKLFDINSLNNNILALSNFHRLVFWKVHFKMFEDSPWFGHSYAQIYSFLRTDYYNLLGYKDFPFHFNAHNIVLEFLVELGIIGTFCFTFCIFKLFTLLKKLNGRHPRSLISSAIYKSLISAFLINLIHGFLLNTLFDSSLLIVYISLLFVYIFSRNLKIQKQN